MKKLLLLILLFASALSMDAGIPAPVLKSFEKKYPDVKKVKWETHENLWEATFKKENINTRAVFMMDGKWMETGSEIKPEQLPGNVIEALQKEHPGAKIKIVWQVEQQNKLWIYRIELTEKGKTKRLAFDKNGKPIN